MRIGLFLNNVPPRPLADLIAAARAAEAQGIHTLWLGQLYDHDALTLATILAAATDRLELGTWVVPTFPRHPTVMAQQALSAQAASGNRLVLGVGLGHEAVMTRRLGLPFEKPIRHMREYLEVLQPLLAQTRVEYVGAEQRIRLQLTLPGVTAPPVLLGALGPQMLRLAGRLADGVAIWLGGARYLRDFALPRLLEVAAAANRPDPRIAVGLPVAVCDDPEIGREAIAKLVDPSAALPSYRAVLERGGAERPSDVALIGPESLVAEQLAELADLGVSDFNAIVVPVPGETGSRERTLSLLASRARARG